MAILDVIDQARVTWEGEYEVKVTVRIGSQQNTEGLKPLLEGIRNRGAWVVGAEPCDPFKLALFDRE